MRVTAIIEDLPPNSYLKGDVFGSSRAAYSQFALYDLTLDQGPFRLSGSSTYTLRPPAARYSCRAAATGTLRLCRSRFAGVPAWVQGRIASDAYRRPAPVASSCRDVCWDVTDVRQRGQDASRRVARHRSPDCRLRLIQLRHADDGSSSPARDGDGRSQVVGRVSKSIDDPVPGRGGHLCRPGHGAGLSAYRGFVASVERCPEAEGRIQLLLATRRSGALSWLRPSGWA